MLTQIGQYDVHPAAMMFPMLSEAELEELVEDMRVNGQRVAIVLYSEPDPIEPGETIDMLLDGRNRMTACMRLGIRPRTEIYRGDDPYEYVFSLNFKRRHLNESQRAMIGARYATMRHGGNRRAATEAKPTQETAPVQVATLQLETTRAQAADKVDVSKRLIDDAAKVQQAGTPELVHAVDSGRVPVSTAAKLTDLTDDEQRKTLTMSDDEIRKAAKVINQRRREERRTERVGRIARIEQANRPLEGSLGKHSVHYWDPPWKYDEGSTDDSRQIENKYPPMELEDICALPVADVCTPDAIMYMWTTAPKCEEAMAVLNAWGFTYRSQIIWHKTKASAADLVGVMQMLDQALEDEEIATARAHAATVIKALTSPAGSMGMGYWARIEHEILLIATRGKFPTPIPKLLPRSVIAAPLDEHSAKPFAFIEMLERMYPTLSKFEGFCRAPRQGWTVWGNQSGDQLKL